MSTRTDGDLKVTHKGRLDHRISKGMVGARLEDPNRVNGHDVSLWRFDEGQRYSLFLDIEAAYDLADCLDALLEYHESRKG